MKNNLIKLIFSSGLQAIAVQVLGVLFFYAIGRYLSKDDFGIINGANAKAVMLTTLLSFGMDQVVVRRIAASKRSDWAASAYLFHAFATSVIVFVVLLASGYLFGSEIDVLVYLPWFFAAQALTFIGAPLKQLLNAKQRFTPYGVIAIFSNLLKIGLAFYLVKMQQLSLMTVVAVMILCAVLELVALLLYVLNKANFSFKFKGLAYKKLIRESLPQYISVIFDSSLSRMDWVLLGLLSTAAMTADYAVASRAFEVARLPLTIIAPILLSQFARMLASGNKITDDKQLMVRQLFTLEMFLAMFIPIIGNILWAPVLDALFKGKYGTVNATEFLLLSICVPIQFGVNLLWTLSFSGRRYKQITGITIYSAITNICLSVVLIPRYGSLGAAISFLLTSIFQLIGHFLLVRKNLMTVPLQNFFLFLVVAAASYGASVYVTDSIFARLLIATVSYIGLSLLFKLIHKGHIDTVKLFIKR